MSLVEKVNKRKGINYISLSLQCLVSQQDDYFNMPGMPARRLYQVIFRFRSFLSF